MGAPSRPVFSRIVAGLAAVAVVLAGVRLLSDGEERQPAPMPSPAARKGRSPDPLPPCVEGDVPARPAGYGDWAETLVDPTRSLKPSYVPPDLVSVSRAGFKEPLQVRRLVIADLAAMRKAAADAGDPLGLAAAFRSYDTQASLYRRRIDSEGRQEAVGRTARPGHSEHQLGTTLDFKTAGALDVTQSWEITPAGQWMADNAWRYGFVLVYPKHQTAKTCFAYEPWHYRYFGRDKAASIRDSGLTVREYLWNER